MSNFIPTPLTQLPTLSDITTWQMDELPVVWVKTDDELYRLIDEIDSIDRVALDTEFIRRDTYYPILALVQVNTGKAIYLVDAPRLDLSDFWHALAEIPEMIWYACGEDLGIFYQLANCPPLTNIIDVQIGVAYLTGELQMGYARAILEGLGVSLVKSESQSDWLFRPLTHEQECYAVDDVRYLFVLWDKLKIALQNKGLMDFVLEDSRLYAQELHQAHTVDDEQLYLDYIAPLYTHQHITVLQALVAWRERLARSINKPRTFILSKQALRDVVLALPKNQKELSHTTINRDSLKLYGNEILAIIKDSLALPDNQRPAMPRPTFAQKDKPFKKALNQAIATYGAKMHIPPTLLLKNRWVNEILYAVATDGVLENDALLGYRRAWLEQEILPLLKQYHKEICAAMGVDDK